MFVNISYSSDSKYESTYRPEKRTLSIEHFNCNQDSNNVLQSVHIFGRLGI